MKRDFSEIEKREYFFPLIYKDTFTLQLDNTFHDRRNLQRI